VAGGTELRLFDRGPYGTQPTALALSRDGSRLYVALTGLNAVAVIEFWVGKPSKTKPVDVSKPFLIYSRPKGAYNGDMANHVLVDFQLVHDTLADGKDHVHIAVTGPGIDAGSPLAADVTKFGTPYYLDNLQDGTYTVKRIDNDFFESI